MIQGCAEGCKTQKEVVELSEADCSKRAHTLKWMLLTVSGLLVGIVFTGSGLLSSSNALCLLVNRDEISTSAVAV